MVSPANPIWSNRSSLVERRSITSFVSPINLQDQSNDNVFLTEEDLETPSFPVNEEIERIENEKI